jgi:hypothetical protein
MTLLDIISNVNHDYWADLLQSVDAPTRQRLEADYRRWLLKLLQNEHERTLERCDD